MNLVRFAHNLSRASRSYNWNNGMMASPPACKPMKPTGWKRARRAYASERILGPLVSHLVEKLYGSWDKQTMDRKNLDPNTEVMRF